MKNVEKHGFKNLPLCDTHFHLVYPETLDSTEQTYREIMDYFSITRINMQCITSGSGHRKSDPANNVKGLYLRERLNEDKCEDRAFVYGSLFHHFDERDTAESFLSQVTEMYEMGFDGYKMLEGKPTFRKPLGRSLCDPIFDPIYSFMQEHEMPLKMHLGDPHRYWGAKETMTEIAIKRGWWYGDGTYPTFDELHEEVYGILKKFPRLKLCMAHFFFLGHDLDTARAFFENWENTSFDLTPGASMFRGFSDNYEKAQKFFADYSHRIFFGSDTYNSFVNGDTPEKYENACQRVTLVRECLEKSCDFPVDGGSQLGIFTPLALSDEQLKNIYFENHCRLHPAPRKINRTLARAHAQKLLAQIEGGYTDYSPEEKALEKDNLEKIIAYFE